MNPEMPNSAGSNGIHSNPVDKLETAFMGCLAAITKEDTLTNVDKDEIRVDVEQGLTNFVEQARSMEGYFLKKRLEIAAQKPELIIKDDASELRYELVRKEELLKKNYEKINFWQSILADLQSAGTQQSKSIATGAGTTASVNLPLQGPSTPGAQGPLTPSSGRPNTPGSVGRPITPVTSTAGSRMHTALQSQLIKKGTAVAGFSRILPPQCAPSGTGLSAPNPAMSSLQALLANPAAPAPDIRVRLSKLLTRPGPILETSSRASALYTMEQQRQQQRYISCMRRSQQNISLSPSAYMLPFQGRTGSCHVSSVVRTPPPPPSPSIMPPPPSPSIMLPPSTAHSQYFYEQASMMTRTNVPSQLNANSHSHANPHQYLNNCFRFGGNHSGFPYRLPSCSKDKKGRKK